MPVNWFDDRDVRRLGLALGMKPPIERVTHDRINALFEAGGALILLLNIAAILRDHGVAGVHWAPTLWFAAWGAWNLIYYRALGQRASWIAGAAVFAVNTAWLALVAWYALAP